MEEIGEAVKRPLHDVRTLLTAADGYPAFEEAALAARKSVWFWFRIFDPDTRLRSKRARDAGCEDWSDLLRLKLREGVEVAVAVSDFDPVGAPALHAAATRAGRKLEALAEEGPLRFLLADHGARAGLLWRIVAAPSLIWRVEGLRRAFNDGERSFDDHPGLAPYLRRREGDGRIVWNGAPFPQLKPATHHQKLAVFDAERMIVGGLDIDERRWDTPEHRRPARETWRDVSVAVDGPVAVDGARYVAALWNRERDRLGAETPPLSAPEAPTERAAAGAPSIRFATTRSRPRRSDLIGLGDGLESDALERAHLEHIGAARELLFIETQFLRSSVVAEALAAQADAAPALNLVLLLPAAPEAVAFYGQRDAGRRLGERLQARHARMIAEAFGPRAVILSPAQKAAEEGERSSLLGAGIIYVHSKVLVADDRNAVVSSANLNSRSLRMDTEAGVVIEDADVAGALRRDMWRPLVPAEILDTPPGETAAALRALAAGDAGRAPASRRARLLPFPIDAAEQFGAPAPGLPEKLV